MSILTRADPNSVVVLGVIDKSLTLLADACKSVDTKNVSYLATLAANVVKIIIILIFMYWYTCTQTVYI